jgi:hypothetical protein
MPVAKYKSSLAEGNRVLFQGRAHHPRNGHYGTILGALPNPSQRPENQWYDVRFEDQSIGRFHERCLHFESTVRKTDVA